MTPLPRTPAICASLLLIGNLLCASRAGAEKTDVVGLLNGDVITGEIKSLERGQLTYSTDNMETIAIKWARVARLASTNWFLVTDDSGTQYFGQLHPTTEPRTLLIGSSDRRFALPAARVVRIARIKESFWERLELAVDLGFSYSKASDILQLTFDGRTAYRDKRHFGEVNFSYLTTDQGDAGVTARYDLTTSYQRTLNGRLFSGFQVGGQGNDELGLRLRLLAGAGLGYRLLEDASSDLSALGGLSVNREWSTDSESSTDNLEAVISASYSLFFYESPETDLQINGALYPGLSSKRVRSEFDCSLRRELVKDLFITLSYYVSYDSAPPSVTAATSDRGIVLKVGWTK
jgi:hypothetical protein